MFNHKTNFLEKLNKTQLAAVTSNAKSFYLIAGAGTGKTTTLTAKIAYLIKYKNWPSDQILALTFTNKAAKQMQEKIAQMIGKEKTKGITICTFHSLGNQILRNFISFLPFSYNTNFKIMDKSELKTIIKDILKEMNIDYKEKINFWQQKISNLKRKHESQNDETLQHITQQEYNFQTENRYTFGMSIKDKYQTFLQKNNLVDFDDLILYAHQLLQENFSVRSFYQQKFQYLLVDEFQDTDFFQYQILTLLSQDHQNIFVVGDPDQNIYSFRGARFENSQLFLKVFKPQIALLEQNYRSSKNILEKANLLIQHNKDHPFKKKLKSTKDQSVPVIYNFFEHFDIETQYISQTIQNLVKNFHFDYQDFIILYKTNNLCRPLEENFISNGIPYLILGDTAFYQSKVVKDFLAYLNVIIDPLQDFDLKRIINIPKRGIGATTVSHLEQLAQDKKITLFEAINHLDQTTINPKTQNKLNEFKKFITITCQELINNSFGCLSDIITHIDDQIGYSRTSDYIDKKISIKDNKSIIYYIEELKLFFVKEEQNLKGSIFEKLTQLLYKISLYSDKNDDFTDENDKKNFVKLSTIHKAKGLEFRVVFIKALEDYFFDVHEKKEYLEESRRLVYVGITRAKEQLFLTGAYQNIIYGKIKNHLPSRFLQEMGFFQKEPPRLNYFSPYLVQTNKTKPTSWINYDGFFQKGDKVKHQILGLGVVETIMQDLIQVRFVDSQKLKIFENKTAFLAKIKK